MSKLKRNILIALAVVLVPLIVWFVNSAIGVSQYASAVADEAHQQFVESKSQMLAAGFTGVVIGCDSLQSKERGGKICYLVLQTTNVVNRPHRLHYYDRYSFVNEGRIELMVPSQLFHSALVGDTLTKRVGFYEIDANGTTLGYLNHHESKWLAE
jgi:hypothetical protein